MPINLYFIETYFGDIETFILITYSRNNIKCTYGQKS